MREWTKGICGNCGAEFECSSKMCEIIVEGIVCVCKKCGDKVLKNKNELISKPKQKFFMSCEYRDLKEKVTFT